MKRQIIFLCAVAMAAGIALSALAVPTTNPAGATLTRISTETWSASTQTNAAGATVQIAGSWYASVDTENAAGGFGYIGHFDPLFQAAKSTGWLMR